MTFGDIPEGVSVFVDANVLVYYFSSHSLLGPACKQLVQRVARQELLVLTSADVLSNMAHRLMTVEAMARFGWLMAAIAQRLRRQPAEIQKLTGFRQAVEEVPRLGVQVLPVTAALVTMAAGLSQQFGLLSGDALVLAVMRERNLTHLASHDADFDRVPGLTRYAPV